jgi:hypothetical protein
VWSPRDAHVDVDVGVEVAKATLDGPHVHEVVGMRDSDGGARVLVAVVVDPRHIRGGVVFTSSHDETHLSFLKFDIRT